MRYVAIIMVSITAKEQQPPKVVLSSDIRSLSLYLYSERSEVSSLGSVN